MGENDIVAKNQSGKCHLKPHKRDRKNEDFYPWNRNAEYET